MCVPNLDQMWGKHLVYMKSWQPGLLNTLWVLSKPRISACVLQLCPRHVMLLGRFNKAQRLQVPSSTPSDCPSESNQRVTEKGRGGEGGG